MTVMSLETVVRPEKCATPWLMTLSDAKELHMKGLRVGQFIAHHKPFLVDFFVLLCG
jgi:hypothetical protein